MKPPAPGPADVLFEDRFLLAVNKAPGFSVLADRSGEPSLLDQLRARLQTAGETCYVVHRLDKGTSGVLLFGKTPDDARELSRQFEKREVEQRYLALVRGGPPERIGRIDLPLAPGPRGPLRMRVDERGKRSLTRFRVVERFRDYALLEILPYTGRTHQIRAHLQAVGHPLAVDPLYGGARALLLSRIKPEYRAPRDRPESPLLDRLSLHALRLEFRHPRTGVPQLVEAPLPKDFATALKQLRKYGA